jgi:hypothetical protein
MSNQLAPTPPHQDLQVSPEDLAIANCYLTLQDIRAVGEELDVSAEIVAERLAQPALKRYIDHVYLDVGFNNRHRLGSAMDAVIKKRFQELEEAGIGSTKDIADLLMMKHKMTMDQLDRQIALEKIRRESSAPQNQVNVQINEAQPQSNYDRLLAQLMKGTST